REGKTHLQFFMTLYEIQIENGMYFLHEHPYSASSWKEPCIDDIMSMDGVKVVRGDMCAFGMWQDSDKSNEGKELVMKPTGFMTNAEGIARELDERCDGYHQHVKLLNGRASRAEAYPDELCFRILKGLMETMKQDGRIHTNGIGAVMAEEESDV
ncbi:MAG: hypothetical protein NLN65_08075, partial [Candidatus Poseidoniaceae archaeon]|nr:hypothetical protein [Candidatus Poseidoniaceae archaeon]